MNEKEGKIERKEKKNKQKKDRMNKERRNARKKKGKSKKERMTERSRTVSGLLPLPVLVQLQHIEEDLAGQAALAAAAVRGEQRGGGLEGGQTPAGRPHRVQRRPRVPTTPRLAAAALHRHVAAAGGNRRHSTLRKKRI